MEKQRSGRATRIPKPGQKLVSLQQGSIMTGLPTQSLRDVILRGHLPAVRLPGSRRIWVHADDLSALIERSTEQVGA